MVRPAIEVVHVGSASRDLTTDDPRGWRLGGGATYAALTTARLGLRTAALIGVDAVTAEADELDLLRAAGVDLRLIPLDEGPVFENRETPAGRVQTCHAVGQPLGMPGVPEAWRDAPGWSLVPVADEVDEAWAAAVPPDGYLAVGWQGMLRDLAPEARVERRAPSPSALLRRADLVGVSRHDVAAETTLSDLAAFLKPGADLMVSEGSRGGLLVRIGPDGPGATVRYRPTAADRETDATGAGDTFLAALLTSILRPAIVGRAGGRRTPDLQFAAAAGSLVVEDVGLMAVPDRAAVLQRRARERARTAGSAGEEPQAGSVDS
jgi:sugar/nucleoside kinase (ribokinase family)